MSENRFPAARDGMEAMLLDPAHDRLVPVRAMLDELLEASAPQARELGCEGDLARVPAMAGNSGAERQLARAREGGVSAAMAQLADEPRACGRRSRPRRRGPTTGGPATGSGRTMSTGRRLSVRVSGMRRPPAGLCDHCRHQRIVRTGRGSEFSLCERSKTDPSFPKYPRVPVLECRGHEPAEKP